MSDSELVAIINAADEIEPFCITHNVAFFVDNIVLGIRDALARYIRQKQESRLMDLERLRVICAFGQYWPVHFKLALVGWDWIADSQSEQHLDVRRGAFACIHVVDFDVFQTRTARYCTGHQYSAVASETYPCSLTEPERRGSGTSLYPRLIEGVFQSTSLPESQASVNEHACNGRNFKSNLYALASIGLLLLSLILIYLGVWELHFNPSGWIGCVQFLGLLLLAFAVFLLGGWLLFGWLGMLN